MTYSPPPFLFYIFPCVLCALLNKVCIKDITFPRFPMELSGGKNMQMDAKICHNSTNLDKKIEITI